MIDDLKLAQDRLLDPKWRLNNLYQIIDKEGHKTKFKMNWAQEELYDNLHNCNIVLKARQLGISTFVCLLYLDRCLFNSNSTAGIIAHTREDAEVLFRRVKAAYESLPPELLALRSVNMDNARELQFNNGSILRVGTSMRGSTLQYLHISEFGKICARFPDKAREIITGSLNTLAPGQYVIIESTAEGREGAFFEMCKEAQVQKDMKRALTNLDYRFFFFPWWKHSEYALAVDSVPIPQDLQTYFKKLEEMNQIMLSDHKKYWYVKKSASQGFDMKREYPSTPDEAFESANEGLYYGAYMSKARSDGRIRRVYLDESVPVHTAWDLGFGDSTAIWFFQICGQEIHLLEYYENSGEMLPFYFKLLKSKSMDYSYLKHFVPHDASVHELGTGLTRIEVARQHGIEFTLAPNIGVDEGIDGVRGILNRCYFDEEKCAKGIKHLEAYKREWDDSHGCWKDKPRHDASSHCCDAFRMLAVSLPMTKPGMTPEQIRDMRQRVFGGQTSSLPPASNFKMPPLNPYGNRPF